MKEITPAKIAKLDSILAGASKATIVVHVNADGDAIGSGSAMLHYLLEVRGLDAAVAVPDRDAGGSSFLIPEEARDILLSKGYSCESVESDIVHLIRQICSQNTFPHEIGLFLGYPPVDVKGFMEDTRKGVKCVGYWKVYGDKEKAEKTFSSYKKCTEVYKNTTLYQQDGVVNVVISYIAKSVTNPVTMRITKSSTSGS